jgi:hypothetical protein
MIPLINHVIFVGLNTSPISTRTNKLKDFFVANFNGASLIKKPEYNITDRFISYLT